MLIFTSLEKIEVFLARMVIPRSRSSSLESITRSTKVSLARNVPLWRSMASTSVVLPWSTCAMMAMLRILELKLVPFRWADFCQHLPLYYGRGVTREANASGAVAISAQERREEN